MLSPCRLQLNSNITGYFTPYTSIPYDPACNGNDYARNIATPDIDMASLHLYPTVAPYWTQILQQQVSGDGLATMQLQCKQVLYEAVALSVAAIEGLSLC